MALDFLVRMRYDENEATHVKDLAGKGYTITTAAGKAITPSADPFGGNEAINLSIADIFYLNALEIKGDVTIAFWAKSDSVKQHGGLLSFQTDVSMYANSRTLVFLGNSVGIYTDHNSASDAVKGDISDVTSWHYCELSTEGNIVRIFVDGILVKQGTNTLLTQYPLWKKANKILCIGDYYPNRVQQNKFYGSVYDFCMIDGIWHTENYNVPTAYIQLDKQGLCISKSPINLLDKTSITGITTEGIQPANTYRHVAFKVDDAWKKLTIASGGAATLTDLATQAITAESLISEGNTAAELANVTSVPGFVGKLVYPAVALYAGESATVMPTFGMTIEGEIDTTINTYTYTDYSQEYVLSTEADVPIVSCVADTTTTGNGSVSITARIKQGDTWSEYMSLESLHIKEANAIQLKAVYNVQTTSGADSCTIDKVTITCNTAGAIVSDATTEIVTVTQEFTNDLTYVHAYAKHEVLNDAEIKAFCSLRKTPQKRTMYQIGNGTGANRVYQLQDSGVNQDTLMIYVDGNIVQDFSYNTETSQVNLTAPNGSVVSASYEYGWESSDWIEMTKGTTQVNDSGLYTTEYTCVVPTHEQSLTVTAVKFALVRPEGTVTNETIGVGTGKRQLFQLPHIAKKEIMQCSGQWNFDQETNILTVIAPEGSDIVVSYNWIAETPKIYGIAAGWAED